MKTTILILTLILFQKSFCQQNYLKTWATYYGDESVVMTDSEIDSQGNIYIVGKVQQNTSSQYDITTLGAHQTLFGGGDADGFISKFNPDGLLLWSTYYGGENSDNLVDISIDKDNNIYCIGSTFSTQNIATINSFQTTLSGSNDLFIVKLNPSGTVLWSTYFGGIGDESGAEINETNAYSGIINDELGNFYIFAQTNSPAISTTGVFQETRNDAKSIIAKFSDTGSRIWSTYYGKNSSKITSIDIGQTGVFVSGLSIDCPPFPQNTYFATANCHQQTNASCSDTFISKFSFDGQRIWSTYYGGTATEKQNSNALKCNNGFVYNCGLSSSNTNLTTPNSFQPTKINNTFTTYLVKFDENGNRMWGTYVGENSTTVFTGQSASKIKINQNNIYLYGATILQENISTPNSYQPNMNSNNHDGYIGKFNTNGERQWGSYFGGENIDEIKNVLLNNDSFYLIGKTLSQTGITTSGSLQPNFLYNNSPWVDLTIANTFLAKFDPNPLSINKFEKSKITIYPNPNDGNFSISSNTNTNDNLIVEIYDVLGKLMLKQNVKSQEVIQTKNLASGIYFANIKSENQTYKTEKIIIK